MHVSHLFDWNPFYPHASSVLSSTLTILTLFEVQRTMYISRKLLELHLKLPNPLSKTLLQPSECRALENVCACVCGKSAHWQAACDI